MLLVLLVGLFWCNTSFALPECEGDYTKWKNQPLLQKNKMNFDQILPVIFLIGVLILVLPSFLQSNSKLKQLLVNLSIWAIIVMIVTAIAYFLFKCTFMVSLY